MVSAAARASRPKHAMRWAIPAAGGALGPELSDLVVLEVGLAEIAQGWPLGRLRLPRQIGDARSIATTRAIPRPTNW